VDPPREKAPELFRLVANPVREDRARFAVQVSRPGPVVLVICDVAGRKLREITRTCSVGFHEMTWDGSDDDGNAMKSGVYYVRARVPGQLSAVTRPLVLLR
jgi:flagellar hook assembly protein FlgD